MNRAFYLLAIIALLQAGVACKRKPPSSSGEIGVPNSGPSSPVPSASQAATAEPVDSAPAPKAVNGIEQAKPGASEGSPLNGELTDAVARFRDKHKRLPASWQELVQSGFLKAVPQPPPGVRYAIDPISAMVVEVR